MPSPLIVVKAAYDPEAGVWFVESSDLAGVNAEASSIEELLDKLPGVVLDLLDDEGRGDDGGELDVPIELVAHASTRVRRNSAA